MQPKPIDFSPLIWAMAKPLIGLILVLVVVGIVVIVVERYLRERGIELFRKTEGNAPYFSKKPLTETEQKFYYLLKEALPECLILAQVQLSSFIEINKLAANENYYKWLNPIRMQSVDYLVCLPDFTIVAAIELDDKYHWGKKSKDRDNKKDKNLEAAGVALIRWHAEAMPTASEIRKAFHNE